MQKRNSALSECLGPSFSSIPGTALDTVNKNKILTALQKQSLLPPHWRSAADNYQLRYWSSHRLYLLKKLLEFLASEDTHWTEKLKPFYKPKWRSRRRGSGQLTWLPVSTLSSRQSHSQCYDCVGSSAKARLGRATLLLLQPLCLVDMWVCVSVSHMGHEPQDSGYVFSPQCLTWCQARSSC